jgi:acetyl-CoA synthetase
MENSVWKEAAEELEYKDQSINIGWYCSDRICNLGKQEKVALIYENAEGKIIQYSFNDLRLSSNTIGYYLKRLGLEPGDRICLYCDKIPALYFSFLGILKIGCVVQPLFSAFGEESLFVRLENAETRVILTQRKHLAKIRKIKERLPYLEYVIILDDLHNCQLQDKELAFAFNADEFIEDPGIFPATGETPSVLHYTSGTTGNPKGVQHTHLSLLSQYYTAQRVFQFRDTDLYWCTADPGWVTGTSYGIIGPWSHGVTQCILDSGFTAQAWYHFIEKHKITVWYTAPTAIRSLMKAGNEVIKEFNLSSLRNIASVGEPLNAEAVTWGLQNFGLPFLDTYWQTETGSIMIANTPENKVKPGSMGKPLPGITGVLLDPQTFQPLTETGRIGLIAFHPGWPAMFRTYWKAQDKYLQKFANGWFLTGDKAKLDADGYYWFVGRDDDIINTAGHLISPFEVESALLEHGAVAESAVVSKPDEINMEVIKAFVVLKPGFTDSDDLRLEIMNHIRKRLSSFAMPQEIEFLSSLPRTRSGKIMRRLLHAKEWNEDPGDTSTLESD